jgi:hypothetical protein
MDLELFPLDSQTCYLRGEQNLNQTIVDNIIDHERNIGNRVKETHRKLLRKREMEEINIT